MNTLLADSPAVELQRLIRAREVSVAQVVEASLERVEKLNGTITLSSR